MFNSLDDTVSFDSDKASHLVTVTRILFPFQALSAFAMASLKILVIGSGGREHALAWRLALSDLVERVFIAPGNGGTQFGSKCVNIQIAGDDFGKLVSFAQESDVRSHSYN